MGLLNVGALRLGQSLLKTFDFVRVALVERLLEFGYLSLLLLHADLELPLQLLGLQPINTRHQLELLHPNVQLLEFFLLLLPLLLVEGGLRLALQQLLGHL